MTRARRSEADAARALRAGIQRATPEPRTTRRRARQMDRIAVWTITLAALALAILTR